MNAWSVGILALYYVGHEDIFPVGDGSLGRAVRLIAESAVEGDRKVRSDGGFGCFDVWPPKPRVVGSIPASRTIIPH
jgi:hypothetical protein